MKTSNPTILGLCLLASAFSVAACAVDEATDDEQLEEPAGEFSQLMVVTDGANTVVFNVSSDVEAYLDRYQDSSYKIEPLFERPVVVRASDDSVDTGAEIEAVALEGVQIDEISIELEEGAIGYSLRYVGIVPTTNLPCSGADKTVFTSSRNFVEAENTGANTTEIKISTRRWSWSTYLQREYDSQFSPGEEIDGGRDPSNRVKLQFCTPATISHSFFN